MAKSITGAIQEAVQGRIGNAVFRYVHGRFVVARRPMMPKGKASDAQVAQRLRLWQGRRGGGVRWWWVRAAAPAGGSPKTRRSRRDTKNTKRFMYLSSCRSCGFVIFVLCGAATALLVAPRAVAISVPRDTRTVLPAQETLERLMFYAACAAWSSR